MENWCCSKCLSLLKCLLNISVPSENAVHVTVSSQIFFCASCHFPRIFRITLTHWLLLEHRFGVAGFTVDSYGNSTGRK